MKSKGYIGNLDEILSKNEAKNNIQVKLDEIKNTKNILSKEIGILAQKGASIDTQKKQSDSLSNEIEILQKDMPLEVSEPWASMPNIGSW